MAVGLGPAGKRGRGVGRREGAATAAEELGPVGVQLLSLGRWGGQLVGGSSSGWKEVEWAGCQRMSSCKGVWFSSRGGLVGGQQQLWRSLGWWVGGWLQSFSCWVGSWQEVERSSSGPGAAAAGGVRAWASPHLDSGWAGRQWEQEWQVPPLSPTMLPCVPPEKKFWICLCPLILNLATVLCFYTVSFVLAIPACGSAGISWFFIGSLEFLDSACKGDV